MAEKRQNVITPYPSKEAEIGHWLGAFQDARARTLEQLEGLSQPVIDWLPPEEESSIGTVLYHIALIEADWLYEEVLEQPLPPEVEALFPFHHRDSQGRLTQVRGFSLEDYLNLLAKVRILLLGVYGRMDLSDFRRARSLEPYDVTPEWVLHHLMQHEAEHRSQIGALRNRAERDIF
jgi:uncharacterized damage-inducible protein DinB